MVRADQETAISGVLLRWIGMFLLGVMLAAALLYIGDFAVFELRGKPQDTLILNQYMAAPLKGNKTEYYYEGTGPVACSRSLFPQGGMNACWRLRNHPSISEQP